RGNWASAAGSVVVVHRDPFQYAAPATYVSPPGPLPGRPPVTQALCTDVPATALTLTVRGTGIDCQDAPVQCSRTLAFDVLAPTPDVPCPAVAAAQTSVWLRALIPTTFGMLSGIRYVRQPCPSSLARNAWAARPNFEFQSVTVPATHTSPGPADAAAVIVTAGALFPATLMTGRAPVVHDLPFQCAQRGWATPAARPNTHTSPADEAATWYGLNG